MSECPSYFVECFGFSRDAPSNIIEGYKKEGKCPFICAVEILYKLEGDDKCIKIPHKLGRAIGACTVEYSGKSYIICPRRFLQDMIVFKDVISFVNDEISKEHSDIHLIKEINLRDLGRVDYIIFDRSTNNFIGVEINALDTTGSLLGKFGINTWHSAKLMFVQIIAKGAFFERYKKKYFWIIQDTFFEDIEERTNWREKLSKGKGNIFILSYSLKHFSREMYRLALKEYLRGSLKDFVSLFGSFTAKASNIGIERVLLNLRNRVVGGKSIKIPIEDLLK